MPNSFEENSYLYAANSAFIEDLVAKYKANPGSVDPSWREFLGWLGDGSLQPEPRASWAKSRTQVIGVSEPVTPAPKGKTGGVSKEQVEAAAQDSVRALMLIRAYRVRGHLKCNLDPLGMQEEQYHYDLDPASYGFSEKDFSRKIYLDGALGFKEATLTEIMEVLKQTYCGTIGVEFMHIQHADQREWIQSRIEAARGTPQLTAEEKKNILDNLIEVEAFEQFLHTKYPGTKRFSVQGGDAMVPGLQAAILKAGELGVEDIAFGMPHRGRMNVLTTVMRKPYAELLSVFHGNLDFPEGLDVSGDVKYHLGVSSDIQLQNGKKVHLSLASNPSHLEAVNPVVAGKVRAKMDQRGDAERSQVMGVMLHGDAAFAGQGSVPETLALSELRGYRTGGTLHVIVNNQIGFTTDPKYSRCTPYPSDVAKSVQAPIFHVNGDDPEVVVWACKLAVEFRQQFKRDTVVDIFCYRKWGHNEGDEPMFTQPLMYKNIAEHPAPSDIYAKRVVADGVLTEAEVQSRFDHFKKYFDEQYEVARDFKPNKAQWLEGYWAGFEKPKGEHPQVDTGVEVKKLKEIGLALTKIPEGFHINSKIARQFEAKRKMMESGVGLDWAMGEALAYGSLLKEGVSVRLSGQDCERGTFSHRHSVLVDQENADRYVPLNNLGGEQKRYEVINSNLSEFAILGFEYGYSLAEPGCLTIWEAQFGDFANGAQVIIDQFIASGEIKWLRMSGLVMLLPHGYEGQGPEHSSARPERFLQLCGEDNMQVVNCTTPANFFHALRRQLKSKFRKPLIVMTPKSLLRHKLAVSSVDDMKPGTSFKRIFPETEGLVADDKIKRVIFTSGKVYYDLFEAREKAGVKDTAILRIEQYYPFPARELKEQFLRYKNAEIWWCQEEPENMGAWRFIGPRLGEALEQAGRTNARIQYAGRKEAASPATGYAKIHAMEQQALVEKALGVSLAQAAKKTA